MELISKTSEKFNISPLNKSKKTICSVFSFNNEYCKYFSAALQSIIENSTKELFYDIIVFGTAISGRNENLIKTMLPDNFSVRFFDISNCINEFLNDIELNEYEHWSSEMYYRIMIPFIMREYERVLYLDSDTICKKDISKLFEIDFEGNQILAVKDVFNIVQDLKNSKETKEYLLETLKIPDINFYFNSGVLMFNIPLIDPKDYQNKIKEAFKIERTNYPDQDMLNYIFKGNVKFIDQSWNMQYHIPVFYERFLNSCDKNQLNKYNEAFKNPSIIHYTSKVKPWFNPETELAQVFWKYARKTDFYEEILFAMYENEIINSRFLTNLYLKLQSDKKVVLWGASVFLENFIKKYKITTENILGIIDLDIERQGDFIGNYEIFPPEVLTSIDVQEIILTIINHQEKRYNQVKKYLKENNLTKIKLVKL